MKTYSISCISYLLAALLPLTVLGFCFENAGNTYGINPTLLESIARVESNMNPKAINKNTNGTSDIGLMQINSAWLRSMSVNANDLLNDAMSQHHDGRVDFAAVYRSSRLWLGSGRLL